MLKLCRVHGAARRRVRSGETARLTFRARRCLCTSSRTELESLLQVDLKASTQEEIRAAYMQMALKTHPDHNRADDAAEQMANLQRLWKEYLLSSRRGEGFTDFGIGCSFDDNEDEAAERAALVEQASRGLLDIRVALSPGKRE